MCFDWLIDHATTATRLFTIPSNYVMWPRDRYRSSEATETKLLRLTAKRVEPVVSISWASCFKQCKAVVTMIRVLPHCKKRMRFNHFILLHVNVPVFVTCYRQRVSLGSVYMTTCFNGKRLQAFYMKRFPQHVSLWNVSWWNVLPPILVTRCTYHVTKSNSRDFNTHESSDPSEDIQWCHRPTTHMTLKGRVCFFGEAIRPKMHAFLYVK